MEITRVGVVGCLHSMGPITLTDYLGLDTMLSILEG